MTTIDTTIPLELPSYFAGLDDGIDVILKKWTREKSCYGQFVCVPPGMPSSKEDLPEDHFDRQDISYCILGVCIVASPHIDTGYEIDPLRPVLGRLIYERFYGTGEFSNDDIRNFRYEHIEPAGWSNDMHKYKSQPSKEDHQKRLLVLKDLQDAIRSGRVSIAEAVS